MDEKPVCHFCKYPHPSHELVLGRYDPNCNEFIRDSDVIWALCAGCEERFQQSLNRMAKRWEKELEKRK